MVISVGALALISCGEMSPAEQARMDALIGCMDKASAAFPVLANMPEMGEDETSEEFRTDPDGVFVMTVRVRGKDRPLSDSFTCQGNLNERTIEVVELNGVKKRPQLQEVWKF